MDAEAVLARADRVAALATWIASALRRIRIVTLIGTVLLALGAAAIGDWEAAGIVVAVVVGILGLIAVVVLSLFAHHLDRAADLPRMLREDMPAITGKARASLERAAEGYRTEGRARPLATARGALRLRKDLNELAEEELAPAQSLITTFNPFRVIATVLSLVATPVMVVVGLGLLLIAALI